MRCVTFSVIFVLIGCSAHDATRTSTAGTIMAVHPQGALGSVDVGSAGKTEYVFTITDQTKIEKQVGQKITPAKFDELTQGMKVEVFCDKVRESFPAQGIPEKIRIVVQEDKK